MPYETQKNRSGLKPITVGQCHHEPWRGTVGSSATSSAVKPRQTMNIAQYPAPSPDHQEGAGKSHNRFSQAIKVLIFNNYLPLITTAPDLYIKNHFSLLHTQEVTSIKKELQQTRPFSETFPSKSLRATRFLHDMACPSSVSKGQSVPVHPVCSGPGGPVQLQFHKPAPTKQCRSY